MITARTQICRAHDLLRKRITYNAGGLFAAGRMMKGTSDMPQHEEETEKGYIPEDHPWIEMTDSSLEEEIRFSLDEIRIR